MRSPSYEGFTKKENRTADPTRLNAWYLKKKELSKEKLNERENAAGSEAWIQPRAIRGLIYPYVVTHDAPAWNPGP